MVERVSSWPTSRQKPNRIASAIALALILAVGALPGGGAAASSISEVEPNDDAESATAVAGAFEVEGDASETDDWFAWSITDAAPGWTIELESPSDRSIGFDVFDDGDGLAGDRGEGRVTVYDLVLEAGDYRIRVPRSGTEPLPYVLRAIEQPQVYDAEPNDADPVPITDDAPTLGRLASGYSDEDRYVLDVPATGAMLRDIRLEWPTTEHRQLCLLDDASRPRVCHRDDDGDVDILDLDLGPGPHVLSVSGVSEPDDPYTLTVDAARVPAPDRESEPNDSPQTAAAMDLQLGIVGRGSPQDPDHFRATVEGETQLWRIEAEGPGVQRLSWIRPAGDELVFGRPAGDTGEAVLSDLLLAPGEHYFRLYSDVEAAYALTATPQGPPDDTYEREPNSDPARAEPYRIGERRVGRLTTADDIDHYRFTAAAREHIQLRFEPPADADILLVLQTRGQNLIQTRGPEPGTPIDLDLLLQAGDYLIRLVPYTPSDAPYTLTTDRLDPFDLAVDQEPNEELTTAQPVPPSLRWEGRAYVGSDPDWYALPALATPGPLRISVSPEANASVRISDGTEDISSRLQRVADEPGAVEIADPPVGVPLFVLVRARTLEPYEVRVEAPGLEPRADPSEPSVELTLDVETDEVAAYWPQAQAVEGQLELTNTGASEATFDLVAATTHHAWSVVLPEGSRTVPAGETDTAPFAIAIEPDVWAEEPVRVSIAAVAGGSHVSTSLELEAVPDAAPIRPSTVFDVPEALLGGLNVAALGVGAVPVDPDQAPVQQEAMLYDDVTPDGKGTWVKPVPLPVEFVVDLAGQAAVPVAGTILNPLAYPYDLRSMPAAFELLLSTDGATWTPALSGELEPIPVDQPFTLEAPMAATHAKLRILSTHGDQPRTMTLGEWKVVAQPGVLPDEMPADLADPARGGHVVRFEPFFDRLELGSRLLDEELTRDEITLRRGDDRFELVFGFKDGRAASLTGLSWQDPEGSDPEARVDRVDVEISLEGALGPWQRVGEWVLERDPDGAVTPFAFDGPEWVRYVRLSSPLTLEPPARIEMPADVGAYERPTADDYRTVLGEWGYTSSAGPLEWSLSSPTAQPLVLDPDAGDSRDAATVLPLEQIRTDSVEAGQDVDWYAVEASAETTALEFTLGGVDARNVRPTLYDAEGDIVSTTLASAAGPGTERYLAPVEPGARYLLRVEQPPLSTVVAFDTSDSMVPYMPFVRGALESVTRAIVPGLDAIQLLPFEESPLLPVWQDQPNVVRDAINNHVRTTRSSGAEASLITAAELLSERDGRRAILLLTDAETSSYGRNPELWSKLAEVEAVIYGVNLGAVSNPARARDLMQGWTGATGGHYAYASTHAEVDRSFERMTTRLRRPAIYTLTIESSDAVLEPPSLSVVAPPGQPIAVAPDTGIGIVLDTSGSMRKWLEGKRRIAIAKSSLRELLGETIAEDTPVAIRTLGPGGKKWKCRSRLEVPLGPLDRDEALRWVKSVKVPKKAGTPLTDALRAIPSDMKDLANRIVVVITDGNESCGGDPVAAVAALEAEGIETTLNIVGFALDDEALKAEMARWARSTGGSYFDATSADALAAAIRAAVTAPFKVYAQSGGDPVATGVVGGDPVVLDPGTYRVEVSGDPPAVLRVELGWGDSVTLESHEAEA